MPPSLCARRPLRSLCALRALWGTGALAAWVVLSALAVSAPAQAECTPVDGRAVELAKQADRQAVTDLDAAIEKYHQATELAPGSHALLARLGAAYVKKAAWRDAASAFEAATKLAPGHARYFNQWGSALMRAAEAGAASWSDASAALERAVALDPARADAHFDLAEVSLRRKDEPKALTHYTRAIELRPNEPVFYSALGDLYLRLGFFDHAERTMAGGLRLVAPAAPGRFAMLTLLAQAHEAKGETARALARYEEARAACGACNGPGEQLASFNLGAAYASASPPRRAEANQHLKTFFATVCRGAMAARYADQCTQTQGLMTALAGTP